MKSIYTLRNTLLVAAAIFGGTGSAQNADWSWARSAYGSYGQQPNNVATALNGDVYITGRFGSSVINFTPMNIPNSGATNTDDFFLAKYDAAGQIQWVATGAGSDDDVGYSVSVDAAGNVYVAGSFESPTFSIMQYTLTNNSNPGVADMFIAKFSSSGNVQWLNGYGGTSDDRPASIVADAQGNTYLAGTYWSSTLSIGTHTLPQYGLGDSFVARFDAAGQPLWVNHIGGSALDFIWQAAPDASGNIVVAGEFNSNSLGFSPNFYNQGGSDIFVASYDASGTVLMSKGFGSTADESAYAVTADNIGIYITGYTKSTALVMGTNTLSLMSSMDMYVAKLSYNGAVSWVHNYAGDIYSVPKSIRADMLGDVYLAGYFHTPSIAFATATVTNYSGLDIYLTKYNAASGSELWVKSIRDHGNEQPQSITTDVTGNLYMAGIFGYSVTIGSLQLYGSYQSAADIFLAKLCNVPPTLTVVPGVTVCPNTVASLTLNVPPGLMPNWFSLADSLLAATNSFSAGSSMTVLVALRDTVPGCGFVGPKLPVTFSVLPAASISVVGPSLVANVNALPGFSWEWYDCLYGGVINEFSNHAMTPYQNGSYALIVHFDNCVDTSDCMSFNTVGLDRNGLPAARVYGTEGAVIIETPAPSTYSICDLLGRTYVSERMQGGKRTFSLPAGIYLVSDNNSEVRKVVVR